MYTNLLHCCEVFMPWFECPVIDSNLRLQKHHVCLPSNKMEPKPLIHSNWGSVWIGLILLKLKTYCWNHCSKIIYKCVNSTVGPIFNKKVAKKWNLWVYKQYMIHCLLQKSQHLQLLFIEQYMNNNRVLPKRVKKKKKKTKQNKNAKRRRGFKTWIQTYTEYAGWLYNNQCTKMQS